MQELIINLPKILIFEESAIIITSRNAKKLYSLCCVADHLVVRWPYPDSDFVCTVHVFFRRTERPPSKDLVRLFIRAYAVRSGSTSTSPWVVDEPLVKKYALPSKFADFLLSPSKVGIRLFSHWALIYSGISSPSVHTTIESYTMLLINTRFMTAFFMSGM